MSTGQWRKSTGFSEYEKVPAVPRSGSQPSGNVVLSSAADGLDKHVEDLPDWSLTSPMYVHFWIRNPCPSQIRDRNLCWAKTCVQCRPTRESMHACMHVRTYVRTYIHMYVRMYVGTIERINDMTESILFRHVCCLYLCSFSTSLLLFNVSWVVALLQGCIFYLMARCFVVCMYTIVRFRPSFFTRFFAIVLLSLHARIFWCFDVLLVVCFCSWPAYSR